MILDFCAKNKTLLVQITITNMAVEVVKTSKYLGRIIDDKLNGNVNIDKVYKRS